MGTLGLEPEGQKYRECPGYDRCLRSWALGPPVWSQGVRSTSNSLGVQLALEERAVLWGRALHGWNLILSRGR